MSSGPGVVVYYNGRTHLDRPTDRPSGAAQESKRLSGGLGVAMHGSVDCFAVSPSSPSSPPPSQLSFTSTALVVVGLLLGVTVRRTALQLARQCFTSAVCACAQFVSCRPPRRPVAVAVALAGGAEH